MAAFEYVLSTSSGASAVTSGSASDWSPLSCVEWLAETEGVTAILCGVANGLTARLAVIAAKNRFFSCSANVLAAGIVYFGSRAEYAPSNDNTRSGTG